MKKLILAICATLLLALSCPGPLINLPAAKVSAATKINKKKVTLIKGQSTTLKITGNRKKIKWTSNKKSVATVNSSGKITAKKKGTAKITAKIGQKKYSCNIIVQTPTISTKKATIYVGSKKVLKVNGTNQKVSWKSSNSKIANVSKGTVTGKKAGTVTITATVLKKKYICKITVRNTTSSGTDTDNPNPPFIPVTSISLSDTSVRLEEGTSKIISASILPHNASNKNVYWYSDDTSIASIEDGKITAINVGTTKITAQNGYQTVTCTIEVYSPKQFNYIAFNDLFLENYIKQTLSIPGNSRISEYDMLQLQSFDIKTGISDITQLKYALNLQDVSINSSNVKNLNVLCGLSKLKSINLGFWSEIDITFMKDMTKLEQVNFSNCYVTGGKLSYIVASPNLKSLYFYNTNIINGEHNINFLAGANNLETIQLWHAFDYETDISVLSNLPSLKSLSILTYNNFSESQKNIFNTLLAKGVYIDFM